MCCQCCGVEPACSIRGRSWLRRDLHPCSIAASWTAHSTHTHTHTHGENMQTPHRKARETAHRRVCHLKRVFCFQMTNTDHYMSRHSKHSLNTDVLNGKHYYEWEHQYEGLIRSIMYFHVQCYCTLT